MPPESDVPSHWDMMFEQGESLRTWSIVDWLVEGQPISAQSKPDHRLAYLQYEGPVSGNRGEVCRVVAGEYHPRLDHAGQYNVSIVSGPLQGELRGTQVGDAWEFVFQATP